MSPSSARDKKVNGTYPQIDRDIFNPFTILALLIFGGLVLLLSFDGIFLAGVIAAFLA